MTIDYRLRLMGAPGSPYTRKMVALLRYRHITHNMMWGDPSMSEGLPQTKPVLHPTFYFEDASGGVSAVTDSTPIIRRLEQEQSGRSVIPTNPVLGLLNSLLEDFGDEWATKYMFHYRWAYEADIDNAGNMIPMWVSRKLPDDVFQEFKKNFSQRQISRIGVVGSNEITKPVIEDSYQRLLGLLDKHFNTYDFLLGGRPSSCDFALHGQLTQLVRVDPTPAALAAKISPRTVAWVDCTEDLSGLLPEESQWLEAQNTPDTLKAILAEVGRVYAPAMLANEVAVKAGEGEWETIIDGKPWTQKTFSYQAKCIAWLREEYQSLSEADKAAFDTILAGTGCEKLFG